MTLEKVKSDQSRSDKNEHLLQLLEIILALFEEQNELDLGNSDYSHIRVTLR